MSNHINEITIRIKNDIEREMRSAEKALKLAKKREAELQDVVVCLYSEIFSFCPYTNKISDKVGEGEIAEIVLEEWRGWDASFSFEELMAIAYDIWDSWKEPKK